MGGVHTTNSRVYRVKIAPEAAFLSFPSSESYVYRKSLVGVDHRCSCTNVAIFYTVASEPAINVSDSIKLPFPIFPSSRVVWDQVQEQIQDQIQTTQMQIMI